MILVSVANLSTELLKIRIYYLFRWLEDFLCKDTPLPFSSRKEIHEQQRTKTMPLSLKLPMLIPPPIFWKMFSYFTRGCHKMQTKLSLNTFTGCCPQLCGNAKQVIFKSNKAFKSPPQIQASPYMRCDHISLSITK